MLNEKQAAALKRVTKKLSAMRQTLTKGEREVLDLLIVGATTEEEGHRASVPQAAHDKNAKKGSKRVVAAAAEVQGHVAYDTRIGAKKDQGMLKDAGMVRESGMAKDSAAAEVMGHSATVAAAQVSAVAAAVREAVAFNAATNSYIVIS